MHGKGRVVAKYYAAGLLLLFTALFIFVSGRSSSLAFQAVAVSPPVNESALSNHPTSSSQLIFWLQSRGLTPSHSLFLSIADASYIAALRNFRQRLDQWGYGENLVVICLDEDCRACDAFHGYPGLIGRSVAYIKFAVNLELAQHGYNFVGFDGDVYLTGVYDPFSNMLPLSNDTWDIQFQPDGHNRELNFGWYFAKPTAGTVELFQRSFATWKADTKLWDQKVIQDTAIQMEFEENSLRVNRLREIEYKNFMLYGSWDDTLFGAEDAVEAFVHESTLLHYTCIEPNLKEYFGRNFGGFTDLGQYYSHPPALLATAHISGLVGSIYLQVVFAAQLASATGRTFIWPDAVDLVQKRFNASANLTTISHRPRFPGIRAVSYASAKRAGLKVVEGRYLSTQLRYSTEKSSLEQIVINATHYVLGEGVAALESRIWGLLPNQVAILDFTNFGPSFFQDDDVQAAYPQGLDDHYSLDAVESIEARWFQEKFETPGISDYISSLSPHITQCAKANFEWRCLKNCE